MTVIVVDVESDGPVPSMYSMVCFGAVAITEGTINEDTFYGETAPISEIWMPDVLKVSGFTREEHLEFQDPVSTMLLFDLWVKSISNSRPLFYSDNNGYEWQFINYYFHRFTGKNPFGHSSRNIGDLYKGLVKDCRKNFKHLRKTKHSHHPVDDARGNAEAILTMYRDLGLGINLK